VCAALSFTGRGVSSHVHVCPFRGQNTLLCVHANKTPSLNSPLFPSPLRSLKEVVRFCTKKEGQWRKRKGLTDSGGQRRGARRAAALPAGVISGHDEYRQRPHQLLGLEVPPGIGFVARCTPSPPLNAWHLLAGPLRSQPSPCPNGNLLTVIPPPALLVWGSAGFQHSAFTFGQESSIVRSSVAQGLSRPHPPIPATSSLVSRSRRPLTRHSGTRPTVNGAIWPLCTPLLLRCACYVHPGATTRASHACCGCATNQLPRVPPCPHT